MSWPYKTGFCGNGDHGRCVGMAGAPGREAICSCHCHDPVDDVVDAEIWTEDGSRVLTGDEVAEWSLVQCVIQAMVGADGSMNLASTHPQTLRGMAEAVIGVVRGHDANAAARRRAELEAYEAGRDEEAVEAAAENMAY